ncbi:MAG: hypothetical protein ABEJ42_06665 [Halobacteriaceae archaeon]
MNQRSVAYASTVVGTVVGLALLVAGEAMGGRIDLVGAGGAVILLSLGILVWLIESEASEA